MWRYLIKLAISGLLVWLLVRNRDLGELLREILAVEPLALAVATACLFVMLLPQALRWSIVLRAMSHPTGWRTTLPITMVGLFFSQTLPSSIGGDGMRMWELRRSGLPLSAAISSVIVDRAAGLLGICVLVTATMPVLFNLIPDPAVKSGVALLVITGYSGTVVALLFDALPERLRRLPVLRQFSSLSASLRAVMLSPSPAIGAVGISVIYQLGLVAVIFTLARGIHVPVSPAACLVLVPIANLSALLPISIAGWGVREGAFVVGFGLIGIPSTDAIALSVLSGLLSMLVGLSGGVVWLVRHQTRETKLTP